MVMRAWSTRSRARTTHGSARPPPSSRRSFISAARITSAPSHRLVSRALSRHHDFESRGLPPPPAPRPDRLPSRVGRRAVHTHRYAKQVPGHHVQVDVTFLKLVGKDGRATRRYQYTAIDDATRIRALKVYTRHTQKNAMHFLDYVIKKFPFRMHTVRTDRGHEFQAQFHWHLADHGIRHVYIKARTPQLNGKVERSHRECERNLVGNEGGSKPCG